MIDILIPSIGRPDRLADLVDNIHATTRHPHRVAIITEGFDTATQSAVDGIDATLIINERTENYAGAVNTAYDLTDGEWLFCGADDLAFHDGWDEACLVHDDDWFQVFGTNDLLNPYVMAGMHSTHSLVSRTYLNDVGGVVDLGPGSFLPECYDHNFTDTEFIGTAKMRARFRPCLDSIVEHLHVSTGKVAVDSTHERSVRAFCEDDALYETRRDIWFGLSR